MVLYPLSYAFLLLLFWITYKIIYKLTFKKMIERYLISAVIVFIFFMSNIFSTTVNFMNCNKINNDEYIFNFLIERCNDNERYYFWKYTLIWPSFFLFTILIPLILFLYMFKHRNNLFDEDIIVKIGFLLNGYSGKTFYWLKIKYNKIKLIKLLKFK